MISFDFYPELVNHAAILDNKYRVLETIGQGRYAKVKVAIEISTDKKYAIKIMQNYPINHSKIESFINECYLLSKCESNNIIKLVNISLDGVYTKADGRGKRVSYYIMEIADYGELFKIIDATPIFPEKLARYYFRQLIDGIIHIYDIYTGLESMHSNNIAHRDIKSENILIDNSFNLKICDFGFSVKFTDDQEQRISFDANELVGSPEYNPPEVTNPAHFGGTYQADQMDIFQSALVLFMMVMKSMPFGSTQIKDTFFKRWCADKKKFWKLFAVNCEPSIEFKDLMEHMLSQAPHTRLTCDQIKSHPWYTGLVPSQEEVQQEMLDRGATIIDQQKQKLQLKEQQKRNQRKTKTSPYEYTMRQIHQLEQIKHRYQAQVDEINYIILANKKKRQSETLQQVMKLDQSHLYEANSNNLAEPDQKYQNDKNALICSDQKVKQQKNPSPDEQQEELQKPAYNNVLKQWYSKFCQKASHQNLQVQRKQNDYKNKSF